jgi:hypothetical protein
MKKIKVFGLLVLILAFGLIFAGCGEAESDTWTDVTSLDQLNGTWKGSTTEKHTYKEWYEIWKYTWNEEYFGNLSMERKNDEAFVFNSAARTFTRTTLTTDIYSGGKINTIWEEMKTWDWGDVKFDDKNHSVTRTIYNDPVSIDESWLQRYQINQNGKKIKRVNYWEDGRDLILTKS